MKKALLFLFVLMLSAAALFAQAPQKMSYQAVVRKANNTLVTSQNVSARISILQGSVNGTPVYVEIHNATTNVNGLLTLEIGGGNTVTGSMSTIDWGNGPFFLKSEIDPDGGVNYSVEGVQQFLSVPYALYAEHSGNVPSFGIVPTDSGYVVSITQPGGTPQTYFIQNGTPGPAGPAGPTGPMGPAGNDGNDGVGIDSISGPVSNNLVDTYTIHYSNGTSTTFTVTNGDDGEDGQPGLHGPAGKGIASIALTGSNNNVDTYTITYTDSTFFTFTVTNGLDGTAASAGRGIDSVVKTGTVENVDTYTIYYTDNTTSTYTITNGAAGPAGPEGPEGPAGPIGPTGLAGNDGNGITSITLTDSTGNVDTYTITFDNGSTTTFTVTNGTPGATGPEGPIGPEGPAGFSPTVTAAASGSNVIITVTDASGAHDYVIPTTSGTVTQLPANWTETNSSSPQYIMNKPSLATVATSGSYNDLLDKPTIPTVPTNVSAFTNDAGYITMDSIPAIPDAQVNADWNATSGMAQILNKPVLADVATSGDYDDLDNKPTIPTVPTNVSAFTNDAGYITMDSIPTIPTVPTNVSAFTNDAGYITMDSIPAIPDAQVNADWEATGGVAEILHKPDIAGMQNAMDSLGNAIDNLQNDLDNALGFVCGVSKMKDYDGNEYNTVKIGNQCWMKENLKTTHYSDGTEIPLGTDLSDSVAYHYYPGNSASKVATYGLLYNWTAAMNGASATDANPSNVQGICPDGWHLPSGPEWSQLIGYVKSQSEYLCDNEINNIAKALAFNDYWRSSTATCAVGNDVTTNNATGFSIVPAGFKSTIGTGSESYMWSTSMLSNGLIYKFYIGYGYAYASLSTQTRNFGFSIRCIYDEQPSNNDALNQSIEQLQNYVDSVTGSFSCGASKVKDYDGNAYATVKIGNQCWMKENLRTTHYSDGTVIPMVAISDYSDSLPCRLAPGGNESSVAQYGYLYNLLAVLNGASQSTANPSGVQGVCPTGWHMPSSTEFTQLKNYLMGNSEYLCNDNVNYIGKALASTSSDWFWSSSSSTCTINNDVNANNASGFSLHPAGYVSVSTSGSASFSMYHGGAYLRSANTYVMYLNYNSTGVYSYPGQASGAMSVRCLRDPETPTPTALTPEDVQNMINNSLVPLQHTIDSLQNVINYQQQQLNENSVCGFAKVTDYDGNEYSTVKIGNQCWMKENLKSMHYSDGTEIPLGTDSSKTIGYRYYPDNDSSTVSSLGYLYNWHAVVRGGSAGTTSVVQGVCPTGWHVPSQDEFTQLKEFVKSKEEYRCNDNQWSIGKALADSVLWLSYSLECVVGNNLSANNATGFSARPTGYYRTNFQNYTGVWHYGSRNFSTAYWASNTSTTNSNNAYYLSISSSTNNMGGSPTTDSKWDGNSVRCLKD